MLHFIVPGPPVAYQRVNPRGKYGSVFMPKECREAKKLIAQYAQLAIARERAQCQLSGSVWHGYPQEGAFWIGTKFYLGKRPLTRNGRKIGEVNANADLDNLQKNCLDAMQRIIFFNDMQVEGYLPGSCKVLGVSHPQTHIVVMHRSEIDDYLLAAFASLPVSPSHSPVEAQQLSESES